MVIIVQAGDAVLRGKAQTVSDVEIGSDSFRTIVDDMKQALASRKDGVAIAAPQIGIPLRIFVVSGRVLTSNTTEPKQDKVFINPVITKLSKEKKWMEEGCLSVGFHYGEVRRSTRATITAFDETGTLFSLGASGLLAQIFQHEVDHLDGILFIDKARAVQELVPDEHTS